MRSLKQSCLEWALLYLVIASLLSALVYVRFPRLQVALASGFIAGFFVWVSVGYVIAIRTRRAEARMMRRGTMGGRPEDGEKVAVGGTIRSSFEALESPISGRRCVAYEYKALPGDSRQYSCYEGFALVPVTIDGPRGSIRLLAAPELAFDADAFTRIEQYKTFRDYIARTQFTVHAGVDIGREIAHLKNTFADDDGRIRYDIRREPAPDIDQTRLVEKILAPGDHVVAIGRYSAARNALVPDETAMLHPVKIQKGDLSKLGRTTGSELGNAAMGCGCLLPVIIAALIGLAAVPLDAIEEMFARKDPSWTEVRVEEWVRKRVRPKLTRILGDSGEVAIGLDPGQARGKLTIGDTTTTLSRAEARRDDNAVEVTLAPDTVVRFRDGGVESLRLPGWGTIDGSNVEVRNFNMSDDTISARILLLSPNDGPRLRASFRAAMERRRSMALRSPCTGISPFGSSAEGSRRRIISRRPATVGSSGACRAAGARSRTSSSRPSPTA